MVPFKRKLDSLGRTLHLQQKSCLGIPGLLYIPQQQILKKKQCHSH